MIDVWPQLCHGVRGPGSKFVVGDTGQSCRETISDSADSTPIDGLKKTKQQPPLSKHPHIRPNPSLPLQGCKKPWAIFMISTYTTTLKCYYIATTKTDGATARDVHRWIEEAEEMPPDQF
jgi:hypothetical protein